MTLSRLLIFIALILLYGLALRGRARSWALLVASVLAIFWLQPAMPIRQLDFWLPAGTLGLTLVIWAVTAPNPLENSRGNLAALVVIGATVVVVALLRYAGPLCCLTPSRPPEIVSVAIGLLIIAAAVYAASRWLQRRSWVWSVGVVILVALFIVLKTEPAARAVSALLRQLNGQATDLALASDIGWLGFSYVAFRLLHVLRDRAAGKLPELSLATFVVYVIFFPAVTAGPIDRADRFAKDLQTPFRLDAASFSAGAYRIVVGVFKKFVLADSLALFALNAASARQTHATGWMWVLLYGFAFRLWLDFSGYTDLALGLGRLLGVKLPENFNRPYLQLNLTQFWNNWHMTLTQWFRAYYFNPLTRALRSRSWPVVPIILMTQLSTMVLVGLWHGVAWNFVAWGAWHGLGLFVHNRWADFMKGRATPLGGNPIFKRAGEALGMLLTFHFVALGWVWFALPNMDLAWTVFGRLFGFAR